MKILLTLTLILGAFFTSKAEALDCSRHRIYCKIISLRPNIDKAWAMKFSNIIYAKSKKYGTDPIRSVAVGMQETSLRRINRKQSVLLVKEVCSDGICVDEYTKVTGLTDLSIWQFHIETVAAFGMDYGKIQNDLVYATDFHFKLMKHKIKRCKHLGDDAWTCYHSITERHRKLYKKMVNRFYKGK